MRKHVLTVILVAALSGAAIGAYVDYLRERTAEELFADTTRVYLRLTEAHANVLVAYHPVEAAPLRERVRTTSEELGTMERALYTDMKESDPARFFMRLADCTTSRQPHASCQAIESVA